MKTITAKCETLDAREVGLPSKRSTSSKSMLRVTNFRAMRSRKQRLKLFKANVPIDRSCCFRNLPCLILGAHRQGDTSYGFYCHVPNGSSFDMTERIERQIARFAPGFCERVLVRRATSTAELESINANLIGGAITGGANDLWQMVARPTLSAVPYRTPIKGIFLCSSSTPPGGGVHGMCGFHAANAALRFCKDIQEALISYSKVGCLKK
jgi:hypothetical protein